MDPNIPPVRQKKSPIAKARNKFLKEEVTRLLYIGSIREVNSPHWLANVVPKKNNKFHICVDFKDLNKACSKDSFPLPNIDQMIDAKSGHELMSFLNAYSEYNQIKMNRKDQEKTSFITNFDKYFYIVMPSG